MPNENCSQHAPHKVEAEPLHLNRTLQELDGKNWGEPSYPSFLVAECHRLRRVPLCDFTPENLRMLIGQQFSLEYLLPLALEELSRDPWVSGDFYEGDLLQQVLRLPAAFWQAHPEWQTAFAAVVGAAIHQAQSATSEGAWQYDKEIVTLLLRWPSLNPSTE